MRRPTFNEAKALYLTHGFLVEYDPAECPDWGSSPADVEEKADWECKAQAWWEETVRQLTEALLAPTNERAEIILEDWDLDPGVATDLREEWRTKCEDEKPQLFGN